jgi:hypothetical protein
MIRAVIFVAALTVLLTAFAGCLFSPSVEETKEKETEVLAKFDEFSVIDCPKADAEHWDEIFQASIEYDELPRYVETGDLMSVLNDFEDALDDWEETAKEEGCL